MHRCQSQSYKVLLMTHLVLEIHFTGQLWQDVVQIINMAYHVVQIISHTAYTKTYLSLCFCYY